MNRKRGDKSSEVRTLNQCLEDQTGSCMQSQEIDIAGSRMNSNETHVTYKPKNHSRKSYSKQ